MVFAVRPVMAFVNSPAELRLTLLLALVPLLFSVSISESVPYTKPVSVIAPFAPLNEADRVAPVALTLVAEPVVTVAFAPPEVPPPDWFQLVFLKI